MPSRTAGAQRGRQSTVEPRAGGERSPASREEAPKLLQVGSALGNHATAALIAGGLLHRKVAIGPADDPLEREADRLADRALDGASDAPAVSTARPAVQRECAACAAGGKRCSKCEEDEETMQREPAAGASNGGGMAAHVDASLGALGPGRAMSPGLRGYFEPRFGHDFGEVRLHTGTTADTAARAARARAFTLRDDVVFAAGEYRPATRGGRRLLAHELAHVVQQAPPAARRTPMVQRQVATEEAPASEPAAAVPEQGSEPAAPKEPAASPAAATEPETAAATTGQTLIVADDAEVGPQQMTKSSFLDELHTAACAAADEGLAATGRDSEGCPWIETYFERYRKMSAERLEGDLRKYVPGAAAATRARDYIAPTASHIRMSVARWAETGEVPSGLPGMGLLGMLGGGLLGGLLGGLGRLFFKMSGGGAVAAGAATGGAAAAAHPAAVAARLGEGTPLAGSVRARMERGLGAPLGGVRLHRDATAARLASRQNARAFTVGPHVAFGAGEYRPGTLVGDALLAHELAHTLQQREASSASAASPGGPPERALEDAADLSAMSAVSRVGLGEGARRLGGMPLPRRRSGLRLQRCDKKKEKKKPAGPPLSREEEIKRLGLVQYQYLEEKRRKEEERQRRAAEKEAKKKGLPPPKDPPTVTLEETIQKETTKSGFTTHPTDPWTSLSEADKNDFKDRRAPEAWNKVVASVKGTELEKVLAGKTFVFKPEEALKKGYYAWQDGAKLGFGMSFIKDVEGPGGPKTVWPNIAHEMGGHFEYGKTYASEIMAAAIQQMPEDQRKKWTEDAEGRRMFHLTYEYPETEIFSELRERRYSLPEKGPKPKATTDDPTVNVPELLKQIEDTLAPEVAKAVVKELKRRVDASPDILERDKKFFASEAKRFLR